ncbi:T9SS type A sorting domain-containing protein [Flavobacterium psychrotolerans]|uniref:Secretion system C-terminal sorting domain-containing protein n=1 Tax=Flavobacterium psychrotolerans TaxID=2169410 RepID=A0A2U1JQF7_9FLAO|nr:T9SS type A sorting domain-containing protein [Flavobacterium psychrotolerans]PWA07416.1 hypothetical protein DB895_01480 [Flavobacterium psychrotolerans]
MKKRVLYLIMCVFTMTAINAQISLIGPGGSGDWASDVDLADSGDGITYTLKGFVSAGGEAKFRSGHDWTINWGTASFPAGTGTQGGANIPVIAGTYDVTFNIVTGEYKFDGGAPISVVKILGTAVTPPEGLTMVTADGSVYKITTTFLAGEAKFDLDGVLLSDMAFPAGTAAEGGAGIMVPAGTFTVILDITTGAYSFAFPTISLIGAGVGGWGVDTDLATVDGVIYTINGLVINVDGSTPPSSEIKFRQNHDWAVAWADVAWPSGTGTSLGANILALPGTYNVTINIATGEYVFTDALSTKGFSSLNFKVFPNPTQNNWNFTSANERIESIQIVDVLGKNVITVSPKTNAANVDASNLTKGIYFAKIATAKANETIKLMKN